MAGSQDLAGLRKALQAVQEHLRKSALGKSAREVHERLGTTGREARERLQRTTREASERLEKAASADHRKAAHHLHRWIRRGTLAGTFITIAAVFCLRGGMLPWHLDTELPWNTAAFSSAHSTMIGDDHSPASAEAPSTLREGFEAQLERYRPKADALETNLFMQVVLIVFGIYLLVSEPRDSRVTFGRVTTDKDKVPETTDTDPDAPLLNVPATRRHLHVLIPLALAYLWIRFGYLLGSAIWSRIYAWEMMSSLARAEKLSQVQVRSMAALFEDGGYVDGWFITACDGWHFMDQGRWISTALFFAMGGLLAGANHACAIALTWRRAIWPGTRNQLWVLALAACLIIVYCVTHALFYVSQPPSSGERWLVVSYHVVVAGCALVFLYTARAICWEALHQWSSTGGGSPSCPPRYAGEPARRLR